MVFYLEFLLEVDLKCNDCECMMCIHQEECECGECDFEHPHNNMCCDFEEKTDKSNDSFIKEEI